MSKPWLTGESAAQNCLYGDLSSMSFFCSQIFGLGRSAALTGGRFCQRCLKTWFGHWIARTDQSQRSHSTVRSSVRLLDRTHRSASDKRGHTK